VVDTTLRLKRMSIQSDKEGIRRFQPMMLKAEGTHLPTRG